MNEKYEDMLYLEPPVSKVQELKNQLEILHEHEKEKPMIKVVYFQQDLKKSGGSYQTVEKQLHRIDDIEKKMIFKDRTTIQFDSIISVEYEEF